MFHSVLPPKKHQSQLQLTVQSIDIFTNFLHELDDATKNWDKEQSNISVETDTIPWRGSMFPHIPATIKNHIETSPKQHKTFKFQIRHRTFHVSIIQPHTIHKKQQHQNFENECLQMMKQIYTWFHFIESNAKMECSHRLHIYIYLTDFKKTIPTMESAEIDEIHANTGMTTTCERNSDIQIYRREEWFKVLIHETMHNLGLDFSGTNEMITNKKIQALFSLDSIDLRIYESYCETWAEILNVVFYVYENFPKKQHIDKIQEGLYYESQWSLFQCSKVLNHYQLTYQENILDDNDIGGKTKKQYKERKTSVFSYYVIKSMFMFHPNEFLELCYTNNQPNIIQFQNNTRVLNLYCDFIESLCDSPNYLKTMEYYDTFIQKNKDTKKYKEILQTLRMTIIE
jgi:hypothetical protein